MRIIKKDGRKANFSKEKLITSILNAFESVDGEITEYAQIKANNIAEYIENEKLVPGITTEEIGDLVENGLMSCKRKDVAKKYVLVRDERSRTRGNTTDKTIHEIVNGTSAYWTSENSNKNAMLASTQRDYMAGAISEDISRRQLLPTDVVKAHDEGKIHFHKLYCGTC